jgi:hypothetical protein
VTQEREYGQDTPLSAWIRKNPHLDSKIHGLTMNDFDWMVHKYRTHVDNIGTREVQLAFFLEEKVNGALPRESQKEILFFQHQLLNRRYKLISSIQGKPISVWHFGVYVVSYPGMTIYDTIPLRWFRFDDTGYLHGTNINLLTFERIMNFDIRPDTLNKLSLRRHHLTRELIIEEETPLGFPMKKIIKRSS